MEEGGRKTEKMIGKEKVRQNVKRSLCVCKGKRRRAKEKKIDDRKANDETSTATTEERNKKETGNS